MFKSTDLNQKNVWTTFSYYVPFICDFRFFLLFWPFSRIFRQCSKNLAFEPHKMLKKRNAMFLILRLRSMFFCSKLLKKIVQTKKTQEIQKRIHFLITHSYGEIRTFFHFKNGKYF